MTTSVLNQHNHLIQVVPEQIVKNLPLLSSGVSVDFAISDLMKSGHCNTVYPTSHCPLQRLCYRHERPVSEDSNIQEPDLIKHDCKCIITRLIYENMNIEILLMKGEHSHPPPPPRKIPDYIKTKIENFINSRPLITYSALTIDVDTWAGQVAQLYHPSLSNRDAVQRVITQKRHQSLPHGDGFEGLMHYLRTKQISNPWAKAVEGYVRKVVCNVDGHIFILCMLLGRNEIEILREIRYIQMDVYFKSFRKPFVVFSISAWVQRGQLQIVLARLVTNMAASDEHFYRMFFCFLEFLRSQGHSMVFVFHSGSGDG